MTRSPEVSLSKIEKKDVPHLNAGDSAIVLQRHEAYQKDPDSPEAGQILREAGKAGFDRDLEFFRELLSQDSDGNETMVLFVSSDTQYANNGYRSMDTAEIAQQATAIAMTEADMDPRERIVNLNPRFNIDAFEHSNVSTRADTRLREPQIFDNPEYIAFLKKKYGEAAHGQLSKKAWAAHESDAEKETREALSAEGVGDIIERTRMSLRLMERYARVFHENNPNKKLLIWATTHYDTISPLVKTAAGIDLKEYVGVENGGGIVIEIKKDSEPTFVIQRKLTTGLGHQALTSD